MALKAYEVVHCPLKPINGIFYLHQNGSYLHEGGKFALIATVDGFWEIWMLPVPATRSKPHCITITPSDSPISQSWMYYSTYNGKNDYVESTRMSVVMVLTEESNDPPQTMDETRKLEQNTIYPEQPVPSHHDAMAVSALQQDTNNVVSTEPPHEEKSTTEHGAATTVDCEDPGQTHCSPVESPSTHNKSSAEPEPHEARHSEKDGDISDTESEGDSSAKKERDMKGNAHSSDVGGESSQAASTAARPSLSRSNSAAQQTARPEPEASSASLDAVPPPEPADSEMDVCPPSPRNAESTEVKVPPVSSVTTEHDASVSQTEPLQEVTQEATQILPPTQPPVRPELTRTASGSNGSAAAATHGHVDKDKEREKSKSSNQHYGRQLLPFPPLLPVEQLPAYTKPVPHMKPGNLASNWKVEEEYSWTGSRTTKYTNRVTHEVRHEKPLALQYAPTVCSFQLKTINRQPLEVFAPAKCIHELGGHPLKASYEAQWEKVEPYWTSTVASYEHEIGNLHAYIKSLLVRQEFTAHREVETNHIIASLEKKLEETQESEKIAQTRADNMMARSGKSYIKRDWQQTKLESTFPAGDDFRGEFSNALINFETFVCDAVNCLEDAGRPDNAAEVFVQAMKSIHEVTLHYVRELLRGKQELLLQTFGVEVDFEDFNPEVDSVGKLFWYSTQQVQTLCSIALLKEPEVDAIMAQMNPLVLHIHSLMLAAVAAQTIDDSADSLRIPKLVHFMLRMHAVALLSDPRCYLDPVPGARIQYRAHAHAEILSPGVMRHGRIKEGDEVEVVLCGLYFDHPNKPGAKPVIPTLVRRLLK